MIGFGKFHNPVEVGKVPHPRLRLKITHIHSVIGDDQIEVVGQGRRIKRVIHSHRHDAATALFVDSAV